MGLPDDGQPGVPMDDGASWDLPFDFEIPDDLSGLSSKPALALIITPFADSDAGLAVAVMADVAGDVFGTEAGAVFICGDASPEASSETAKALSAAMPQAGFLLLRKENDMISGTRWMAGESVADVPVGLIVNSVPDVIEQLLLGTMAIDDVPDKRSTDSVSKVAAMKLLAKAAKAARKQGRGRA